MKAEEEEVKVEEEEEEVEEDGKGPPVSDTTPGFRCTAP